MDSNNKSKNENNEINESNINLTNIKSNYILSKIFVNIKKILKFEIIKYNKKLQNRLNLNIDNYREYSEIFTPIEIEIIPIKIKNEYGKFININRNYKSNYHIYFNDNKEETKNKYEIEEEDKMKKAALINEQLDMIRATLIRQTMFAEFEMIMHDKESNGIPLTEEEFSNTYYELNKLYYGDNVVSDDLIRYEWARIPHFYTSFYVYKYATGLSAALAIASDILSGVDGVRDNYLKFLSSGCSDYPLNILKKVGVDMTTKEPIEKALKVFKEKLEELKKLI